MLLAGRCQASVAHLYHVNLEYIKTTKWLNSRHRKDGCFSSPGSTFIFATDLDPRIPRLIS